MKRPSQLPPFRACALLFVAAGCAAPQPTRPQGTADFSRVAPRKVELVNLTTRTQQTEQLGLGVDQLGAKAAELHAAGKLARLDRLIARYPDVALQLLRETTPTQAGDPRRQAVAESYDRMCGPAAQAGGGWLAALRIAAESPAAVQSHQECRARIRGFIEQGRFDLAAGLAAGDDSATPPYLRAELLRLRGIALFLDNQFPLAVLSWQQALGLASADLDVAAELELLASEARRRSGDASEAAAAWSRSAERAATVADPVFWERLLRLKPENADWPSEVQARFTALGAASYGEAASRFDDGLIWSQVADWRLARGEDNAALLDFTQAEKICESKRMKDEARIGQACALLATRQNGPAAAILSAVSQSQDAAVARHALAVLGVAQLQLGRTQEGIRLLEQAVGGSDGAESPGDVRARCDLGLAYLSIGRDDDGLRLLHESQEAFRRDGRVSDLCQALANEISYLRRAGKADNAQAAQAELTQLETQSAG